LTKVAEVTGKALRELASQVVFPVFEFITPEIYDFDVEVLDAEPIYHLLNYNGRGSKDTAANRREVRNEWGHLRNEEKFKGNPLYQLDEYPYASTWQGGEGAYGRMVPTWENGIQGIMLSCFYRGKYWGHPFIVLPIPL
jgi:hypothetical protein